MTTKLNKLKFILLLIISFSLIILISIPFRIAIARVQATEPQAILVLGGDHHRERFAAKLAHKYPTLPIWISSGSQDQLVIVISNKHDFSALKRARMYAASDSNLDEIIRNYCVV